MSYLYVSIGCWLEQHILANATILAQREGRPSPPGTEVPKLAVLPLPHSKCPINP